MTGPGTASFSALAKPNADSSDNYTLDYLGHFLSFSAPVILAVLASPPYYSNADYLNYIYMRGNTYGFTEGKEDGMSQGGSFQLSAAGVYHRLNIGPLLPTGRTQLFYEVMYDIGIFNPDEVDNKRGANVTLSGGKKWLFGHANSVTTTFSYSAPGGEDTVLFTTVPLCETPARSFL